jgi:AcrR family transcriptional regulator
MPRRIDPELESSILQAARKLWRKGGEKALSMRAVAKAAGTNTPAVYRRFTSREEILGALVRLFQQELFQQLEPCRSVQELAEAYLSFALNRPREYGLMMSGLLARMTDERPNFNLVLSRVADWYGGTPEEHEALVFTLYCLLHGCALLVINGSEIVRRSEKINPAVRRAVDILVANEAQLRRPAEKRTKRS